MLTGCTMALGAGALTGMSSVNFTVYPSIAKRSVKKPNPYVETATLLLSASLMLGSLTLLDNFNAFAVIPAIIGFGTLWTSIFMKSRSLEVPLWYMRQYSRLTLAAIFITLLLGYSMVSREF